jgi:PAS domain S-box-containing protein
MSSIQSRQSWRTANPGSPFHTVVLVCLVAFLSYLAAELGGSLVLRPQMVWPLWPACAFLVAVVLLAPRRIWPILIVAGLGGFVVYDLQEGLALRPTVLLILADTVEVFIVTLGVSYSFDGPPRLNSVEYLARYSFFAVILAPLTSAFISSAAFGANYWIRWRIGFFTEALALLTITPAILSWVSTRQAWKQKSRAFYFEAGTLIAGLSVLGYVAFVTPGRSSSPVLLYSLLPFLLWSALRFGLMGISTSMIAVAFLSIWGAIHGRGPFTGSEPLGNVMSLQLFLFFAATPFMVLAVLVEEQKQTEQAFRESEKRFRLVADTAPVLIWMAEADKLCTYFNKPWLDFTGRSLDLERGNGWAGGVHPEDSRRCMDTYTQAFDRREEFRMEYRLRRHDGEYRWVIDIGVPRFSQDHSFIGYIGIGIDVTERKQAEEALRESEGRFRLAAQAGKMFAYEWDAATDAIVRSAESSQILGIAEAAPATGQQILAKVHPHDREGLLAAVAALSADKPDLQVSYRMVRPDGSVIWVERKSRAHFDEQDKMLRIVGMVADITARKRAEEALRESEARLRLAAQAGKMYAYEWDVATDVTVRSEEYANILGLTDVPRSETHCQFSSRVHPDDRAKFNAAVADLTPENPTTKIGYRALRPDGAVIWLEKSGRAFFDAQGRMLRMIGIVADITERKLAEEALSSMSRRLIEAQEKERARIARELHDDMGQRLALLANELEQLQQKYPDLRVEVSSSIRELQKHTLQIATDVQTLSHELHSSKLEYLGIAAAMRGFCQEFGGQQKVKIDFKSQDVPSPLSQDISLCLFRVLQEALHNSVRHSGVRHFRVELWGTPDEIHLAVSDSGVGFDRKAAMESRGLGLISMQERLKILKGTFSIEAQSKRGTTIHARVPFSSGSDSMGAAG